MSSKSDLCLNKARHVRLVQLLALLFICFFFNSCSVLTPYQASDAEKRVVLGLSGDYLKAVLTGDIRKLDELMFWIDYLNKPGRQGGKQAYFRQLNELQNLWNYDDSPIVGLTVMELNVTKDRGEVKLHKKGYPEDEQIWILLEWIGHGWVVTDDNIFGEQRLLSVWIERRKNS